MKKIYLLSYVYGFNTLYGMRVSSVLSVSDEESKSNNFLLFDAPSAVIASTYNDVHGECVYPANNYSQTFSPSLSSRNTASVIGLNIWTALRFPQANCA